MSLLDELFGQILQSEETIKQRFDQLKDAHSQILEHQSKIKDAEFDLHSHHGTMAVKNQKLIKEETELKWLTARERILKSQLEEVRIKNKDIMSQKAKLQEIILSERNNFLEEAKKFSKKYELPANLERVYEKNLDNEITALKQQKLDLLSELKALACHLEKMKDVEDQAEKINKSVMEMLLESEEKQESLKKQHESTEIALANKKEISSEPNSTLEFKRISDELNACQSMSIELNKRRQDLMSELYHNQQQFMKVDSKRKACVTHHGSQVMKNDNVHRRVNLFKSIYAKNDKNQSKEPTK